MIIIVALYYIIFSLQTRVASYNKLQPSAGQASYDMKLLLALVSLNSCWGPHIRSRTSTYLKAVWTRILSPYIPNSSLEIPRNHHSFHCRYTKSDWITFTFAISRQPVLIAANTKSHKLNLFSPQYTATTGTLRLLFAFVDRSRLLVLGNGANKRNGGLQPRPQ